MFSGILSTLYHWVSGGCQIRFIRHNDRNTSESSRRQCKHCDRLLEARSACHDQCKYESIKIINYKNYPDG